MKPQFTNDWSRSKKINKTIVQFKDNSVYLLNDERYIFQDKPLENFMYDNNMDENVEKVLLLITELPEGKKLVK